MCDLDTADIAASDRPRLVIDHLTVAAGRCRITHLCDEAAVWARARRLRLSPTAWVCHFDGSVVRVTRRADDVTAEPTHGLTFAVPASGGGTLWQGGRFCRLGAGDLVLVDAGAPYDYRSAPGALCAVHVDLVALGVPPAVVRTAASRLRDSPLHDLVRDHVRALAGLAFPPVTGTTAADDVAGATVLLLAALLQSCGVDGNGTLNGS